MPWKKGQSGNPNGRLKDKAFAEAIRIAVNGQTPEGKRKLRAIAEKIVDEALAGQPWAVQMVGDRLDGKPLQEAEHTFRRVIAAEVSDDELADIATGSSDGVAETPVDPSQLN